MKLPRLSSPALIALAVLPVIAHAHPGHDGDHELVWDFGHFLSHPLATIAGISLVAAAGWAGWRLLKSKRTEAGRSPSERR